MRVKDYEIYDEILRELFTIEMARKECEARALFRLLNVCPQAGPTDPQIELPAGLDY